MQVSCREVDGIWLGAIQSTALGLVRSFHARYTENSKKLIAGMKALRKICLPYFIKNIKIV